MTQQQMQDMAKQLEELQSLDGAMAELQDAKNGMAGDGMNQLGDDMNNFGMGNGQRKGMGNGLGRGRGQGDRPIAPDETATYTSKVKQQLKKGKAVFQGLTAPTNTVKGDVVIQMQEEIESGTGVAADALSNQKIPRHLEKHVRGILRPTQQGKLTRANIRLDMVASAPPKSPAKCFRLSRAPRLVDFDSCLRSLRISVRMSRR